MKKHTGQRIAVLALTGLLGACGGAGDTGGTGEAGSGKDDTVQPVRSSEYAGQVADEHGLPVAGIAVRLEDRITDEVTEVLTAADGSFSAAVEPGVYDVIFDDPDAKEYVSVQKTAVDLRAPQAAPAPAPAPVQVRLPAARPLPSNLLQGTASYPDGKPAAHRKLLIEPLIARSRAGARDDTVQVPDPVVVETDAQGVFTQPLGTAEMDLDFDVKLIAINAPGLQTEKLAFGYKFASAQARTQFFESLKSYIARYAEESINVNKPDGPMQLDLNLGSPVHNLRSATGTANGIPGDEQQLLTYDSQQGSANNPPVYPPVASGIPAGNKFTLSRSSTRVDGIPRIGKFFGGKLDVSNPCALKTFKAITDPASGDFDTIYSENTSVCVTPTGWTKLLSYTHKVIVKTDRPSKYKFTDETGDRYTLRITGTRLNQEHTVRYRSNKPAIVDILFTLPE
ncbi:carboxypeptidase-like regulatory domain-containing protein [Acidovorax sp. CCYZU-2555]|uniref:carboxypeptidase-like regulatory domain-containing protein n=1 Tax=Acidovorax sp. CCYZU-2555 TaxID=2835042 RepID=UPI001BCF9061|nr:carboxypeptidase-like regulatory domain-containing protein [Acidovorax sp. CCYZU-2555]MBS7779158.1 carboxypeptidase regulatory-like domain-containing protein [Acidovorax sp. CCYZU-2555]